MMNGRTYNFIKLKTAEPSILTSREVIFQKKYDGISTEIFIDEDGDISITGRGVIKGRDSDFTRKFPELVSSIKKLNLPTTTDFLSETIVINQKTGKEDCGLATGRSGREIDIDEYSRMYPASMVIHDVVFIGGQNIYRNPYLGRLNSIRKLVTGDNRISIIECYTDGMAEWEKVKKLGLEGIVIRDPYASLGSGVWKLKREITEDVYCKGEYEMSTSETYSNMSYVVDGKKKTGVFSNLICYQLKNGVEIKVCDVGGGFKHNERIEIQKMLDRGEITSSRPLVLEVKANDRHESGRLRHPAFLRIRKDKPWKECTINDGIVFDKQKKISDTCSWD